MIGRRRFLQASLALAGSAVGDEVASFRLSPRTQQAIVGIAPDWNSTEVRLQRFERAPGRAWQPVGGQWRGRLGTRGLVWGRGLHPVPPGAALKKEGDKRAPAGVFGLGGAFGYAADLPRHPQLPYRQITSRDLWVEDPSSSHYNRHLILPHEPRTAWERKQQMKQDDAAHALKLLILHNSPPNVVAGGGSSIFVHIWRGGGSKTTSGCTTMSEGQLRELIRWLNPEKLPVYVLLPEAEYLKRMNAWNLPPLVAD